nr:phage terminase large subunit family protein [Acidobacteriota bacterium]
PFNGRAGFHIWEGYSPFVTWGEMAKNFLEAKKSRATLKVFVNTSLAEGWEELPEQIHTDDLGARCEGYEAEVPAGVLVLTAGVDVQGDRLEIEVVGWGMDEEAWSIDYRILDGDPGQPHVWQQLKELLTQDYQFEIPVEEAEEEADSAVTRRIACVCIDSGGHHTQEVYRFCRQNSGRRWYAVKGANTPGKPLVSKPSHAGRPPVKLFSVGTEAAKDTIAAHLALTEQGPGYMHFPTGREESYFKQLRSERPVTRYTRGQGVRRWEKIRPSARNEALDLRVYAMAALAILRPDFKRLQRQLSEAAAARTVQAKSQEAQAEMETDEEMPEQYRAQRRRRGRGGFVNRW